MVLWGKKLWYYKKILWYYKKNYGTMIKLGYYTENYGTLTYEGKTW